MGVPNVIHTLLKTSEQRWIWEEHSDCGERKVLEIRKQVTGWSETGVRWVERP